MNTRKCHEGKCSENEVYISFSKGEQSASKWYLKHIRSLKEYAEYIQADKTTFPLSELENKTLVCWCDFWKKCHGHVLMYLCAEHAGTGAIRVEEFTSQSPLSNCYPFPFTFENVAFKSLIHAYYWVKSSRNPLILEWDGSSLKELCQTFKSIQNKASLSFGENMRLLHHLLTLKKDQCGEFRDALSPDTFYIENRNEKTFGKGPKGNHVENYSGWNVSGWLIMSLCSPDVCDLRKKLILACKGIVNENFMSGLRAVHNTILEEK